MKSTYKKLGQFIEVVNIRNTDLAVERLLGVSIRKVLIPSIANTIGTNMKTYKIIKRNQFAYGPVTSRNGDKISIALLEDYDEAIISQAYVVFEVIDKSKLLPEYAMMWFRRPEFDRYARFKSHGSARETFDWDELCETELPVPSIEKQQEIVAEYNTITNRIALNEQLNQKLEETAQALYKHWFVDFEFPCLPSDYRPHGQVNLKITVDELKNEISKVCTYKRIGGVPIPDGTTWFIYLILCEDNSIYKGMANDLYRRFYEHYTGQGAKHTKQHKPVKLIHWEQFATKGAAAKREKELKTGYGRTWISRQIEKAGGLEVIKAGLPAPECKLRTAGKMVYNEKLDGEIPVGWEDCKLERVYSFQYGKGNVNPDNGGQYPVYGSNGIIGGFDYYNSEDSPVIGHIGANCGSVIFGYGKHYVTYNGVICNVKNGFNKFFGYAVLLGLDLQSETRGSSQPFVSYDMLYDFDIILSNNNVEVKLTKMLKPIFERIIMNTRENLKLIKIEKLVLSKLAKVEIN